MSDTPPTLRIALATLLLSVAVATHATEHFCGYSKAHPIDKALDAAIQRSGGVTVDLNDAQSEAYSAWDKELNRVYAQLLKAAGPSRRDALRAAQRAWLAFDTAQAQWDGTLLADQGTSTSVNLIAGALSRRRARVCDLRVDLDSLQATQ